MFTKSLILASLPIASLSIGPSLCSIAKADYSLPMQEEEEDNEGCTVMYVGKDVSADGNAIIARSSDSSPHSMLLNARLFEHNELAGQTVKGNNGFTWKMPDTTYRYISTPRNPVMGKGFHWEASGINENGVGVSATLSCATNSSARTADPHERDNGISEDNITQVICAVATSARQGMEYLAHIIDEKGSRDPNTVLMIDQNEAWYMEMYTGHQYVAIKLPDDQACTIGNEFNLDNLEGIDDNDIIASPELMSLPMNPPGEQQPFVVWDVGHEGEFKHLDLFHTYAQPLEATTGSDHNHTRTWRGRNMFCRQSQPEGWNTYESTKKYPAFFRPDRNLSVDDVKLFMRDRYEDITDPNSEWKIDWFVEQEERHNLHYVANEGAYQVHIIEADADLPKELSCTEWLCLSASNYAPFVPINCANTKMTDMYTHQTETLTFDENAVTCIYRALNLLADLSRKCYGLITQDIFEDYEDIWQKQYNEVIEKVKNLPDEDRNDILNNFTIHIQNQAIALSKQLFKFLLKHVIDDYRARALDPWTDFTAFVDLEDYATMYGWDYKFNPETRIATLTHEWNKITVDANYTLTSHGKISYLGETWDVYLAIDNNRVYLDYTEVMDLIPLYELAEINIDDYRSRPEPEPEPEKDPMKWMVPLASTMPVVGAGAGVGGTTFVFKFKKGKLLKIFKK